LWLCAATTSSRSSARPISVTFQEMAGLSKFARAVKYHAAGLWTQEELTDEIANYLEDMLEPLGCAVIMEAEHFCMSIRGTRNPGAMTITSSVRGVFLDPDPGRDPKSEFVRFCGYH